MMRCAGALSAMMLLLAGGCGSESPAADGPWVAELKQRAEKSDNEYVKRVFSDGRIEASELSETVGRMESCLAEHDVTMHRSDDGSAYFTGSGANVSDDAKSKQFNELRERCGTSTGYDDIDFYWQVVKQNPGKVEDPVREYVLPCLKRNGIVDESFTKADYDELMKENETEAKTNPSLAGTRWDELFGPYTRNDHPQYTEEKDAIWRACSSDPTNN